MASNNNMNNMSDYPYLNFNVFQYLASERIRAAQGKIRLPWEEKYYHTSLLLVRYSKNHINCQVLKLKKHPIPLGDIQHVNSSCWKE